MKSDNCHYLISVLIASLILTTLWPLNPSAEMYHHYHYSSNTIEFRSFYRKKGQGRKDAQRQEDRIKLELERVCKL